MEKIEIERRFLLKSIPDTSGMDRHKIVQIYSEYLYEDGFMILNSGGFIFPLKKPFLSRSTVRLRAIDNTIIELNIKSPSGGYKLEFEERIPFSLNLMNFILNDANRVEKERFSMKLHNYDIFHDIFRGRYEGLVVKEIEFHSGKDAQEYLPERDCLEIFDEHRLSNKDLYFSSEREIFNKIKNLFRQ
ncbi:MAG: hypothetical protein AB7T10_08690 [bacterium]